ncbi:hypothetical protein E4U32_005471 [Claviceps aff. humidiphila group G2b]|nr:hypothetical protein E4U32_005471 [Claviceps aff. humidiphila group G2b]
MPLLFGDVVFDLASGHNMLSGDALVRILAMSPDSVQRCIFVTGVAGIYTREPMVFDDAILARQLRCSSADTDQGVCDEPDAKGVMGSKWHCHTDDTQRFVQFPITAVGATLHQHHRRITITEHNHRIQEVIRVEFFLIVRRTASMGTVVIKLGGAAITDKAKENTLSPNLDTLVDKVARIYQTQVLPQGRSMVLVHGTGPFGNIRTCWVTMAAHEPTNHGCQASAINRQQHRERHTVPTSTMSIREPQIMELHSEVLRRLENHRALLPVFGLTANVNKTYHGEISAESRTQLIKRVRECLSRHLNPVIVGETAFDVALGTTIVSGDALMHVLATGLETVQRCVFVTDVAGLYTKDPKIFANATLVRQVRHNSAGQDQGRGCSEGSQVTEAMCSKLQWVNYIMRDAPHVSEVVICQVSDVDRVLAVAGHGSGASDDDTRSWTSVVRKPTSAIPICSLILPTNS